jgi:pSer/pThr/pTyr-binding forkhead associated (FHA) protein
VRDLGSRNGTQINGMQIGRPADWFFPAIVRAAACQEYELHDGDELRVGDTTFTVGITAAVEGPAEEVEDNADELCWTGCRGCCHGLASHP